MTKTFAFRGSQENLSEYVEKELDMLKALQRASTVKRRGNRYTVIGIGFGGGRGRKCSVCGSRPADNNVEYKPFCDSCLQKYWDQQAADRWHR